MLINEFRKFMNFENHKCKYAIKFLNIKYKNPIKSKIFEKRLRYEKVKVLRIDSMVNCKNGLLIIQDSYQLSKGVSFHFSPQYID